MEQGSRRKALQSIEACKNELDDDSNALQIRPGISGEAFKTKAKSIPALPGKKRRVRAKKDCNSLWHCIQCSYTENGGQPLARSTKRGCLKSESELSLKHTHTHTIDFIHQGKKDRESVCVSKWERIRKSTALHIMFNAC